MPDDPTRRIQFVRALGGSERSWLATRLHPDGIREPVVVRWLVPEPEISVAKEQRERLRAVSWVRHSGFVRPIDVVTLEGHPAVLWEWVDGVDLRLIVGAARTTGVPVPLRVALGIGAAVAATLDAAWHLPPAPGEAPLRIVHRDLRPSRIRVVREGVVRVTELGQHEPSGQAPAGPVDGVPPEARFGEPLTTSGDVYALGAILYRLLVGEDFGEAASRQVDQEERLTARFRGLIQQRGALPREIEDPLHDLLYNLLAFGAEDRPTAAQAASRMRVLGRRIDGETLVGWAAEVVPVLTAEAERVEVDRGSAAWRGLVVPEVGLDEAPAVRTTVPPPLPVSLSRNAPWSGAEAVRVVGASTQTGAVPRVAVRSPLSLPGVVGWEDEEDDDVHTVVRAGLPTPIPPRSRRRGRRPPGGAHPGRRGRRAPPGGCSRPA